MQRKEKLLKVPQKIQLEVGAIAITNTPLLLDIFIFTFLRPISDGNCTHFQLKFFDDFSIFMQC